MDINQIKAGEYQLVADRWDERTSKPGEPFTFNRHRRGDIVQLSEADARRLVLAGAAVKPGELERQAAEAARRQYLAALAQLPEGLRQEMRAQDTAEALISLSGDDLVERIENPGAPQGEDDEQEAQRPPRAANKAVWLNYRGLGDLTEEQVEAITVQQLQDDDFMASYQRPDTAGA